MEPALKWVKTLKALLIIKRIVLGIFIGVDNLGISERQCIILVTLDMVKSYQESPKALFIEEKYKVCKESYAK